MKKNTTYVSAEQLSALVAASGLPVVEKSGWLLIGAHATKGPRLYVPKTKKVGRVDLVGLDGTPGTNALGGESFGAVTSQLNFNATEDEIKTAFVACLQGLISSQPFAPKERPAKVAGPRKASSTKPDEGTIKVPKERLGTRADRMATIRAAAAKHGVSVSADVESEMDLSDLTGESA